jgi:hypothetical protein
MDENIAVEQGLAPVKVLLPNGQIDYIHTQAVVAWIRTY